MRNLTKYEMQMRLSEEMFRVHNLAFELWFTDDGMKEELHFYDQVADLMDQLRERLEDFVEPIDWSLVTPDYLKQVWAYYESIITEWDEMQSSKKRKLEWISKGWRIESDEDKEDVEYLVGQYKRAVALGYVK